MLTPLAHSFVNMIETDAARPIPQVATISPTTGFTLADGLVVPSPVIFLNGVVFMWDVGPPGETDWDGFSEDKWKVLEVVTPRPGACSRSGLLRRRERSGS
jgi:NADH dehydrogenase [ubiquinone] 1 alpha subcomplex assembly factor 3